MTIFVNYGKHLPEDPFLHINPNAGTILIKSREDPVDFSIATQIEWEYVQAGILNQAPDIPNRCTCSNSQAITFLMGDLRSVNCGE